MHIARLIAIVLWIAGIVGWILNLVKLIGMLGHVELLTLLPVLRIVGLFVAPLGSVLGFIPN